MKNNQLTKTAMKVSFVSIVVNILLSGLKLIAGIIGNSSAMVSDAVHSASDVFSTFVVIIGVNISDKESDKDHPYGHERMECIASIVLAGILFVTGIGIGYSGIEKIFFNDKSTLTIPGYLPLAAAILSIVIKEWMYWYTLLAAKKINSGSLKADAWHHRSDALSSVGSFVGILGARLGFPILDPIASVVICLLIIKASFDIVKDAIDKLVDKACSPELTEEMRELIIKEEGVLGTDLLKTRLFGSRIYVDVEIVADGNLSLYDSHEIAQRVHDRIEEQFSDVKHCMVHVNPQKTVTEENIEKSQSSDEENLQPTES